MKLLLDVLQSHCKFERTPIWFMRQAGRYLPEYQEIRKKYLNFLEFTRSPDDAAAVTLQPLHRFDLDAAIIFSDILVVPAALGQHVTFKVGEGPVLDRWNLANELNFSHFRETLQPTLDAIKIVKSKIDPTKTLIGFAGAPWTLACYMITGHGSKDYLPTIIAAYSDPERFKAMIEKLTTATIDYLSWQIEAGADVVQLFDSWASLCPEPLFDACVVYPLCKIIQQLKLRHPNVPVIVFAKGVGYRLPKIIDLPEVDGVGIDQMQPLISELNTLKITIQGGLDPFLVHSGGHLLQQETRRYLNFFKDQPYIFNLGHGIYKETPLKNIYQLIDTVREWDQEKNA